MVARPGFLGGLRQAESPDDDGSEFSPSALLEDPPVFRLGDPDAPRPFAAFGGQSGVDPVWGTLGSPTPAGADGWLDREEEAPEGIVVAVEIFGNGFQISGQLRTGQFDRLSDWINMQTGFIQVRDALQVHLGLADAPDPEQRRGTLWVRLDQVALLAERTAIQPSRPGAPVIQKQRRKVSIITPGYNLQGSLHVHAHGSMAQFLESPDPRFIPITELTVRWLASSALIARFPFALVNREQLVTILDQPSAPASDQSGADGEAEDETERERQQGAA
jgi:hypothetical protein